MSLKLRLTVLNFFQYYIWGAWLLTIGTWWFQTQHWSGTSFGAIFSTMGIASLFMPSLVGIVADKWINAERLYGMLQIAGAMVLFAIPHVRDPEQMFWVMLLNMCFYMPTISLAITVAYNALKQDGLDVVNTYPPIRVWGTIGFIAATWTTSLLGFKASPAQFHVAAAASLLLGLYAFTLPKCPPKLGAAQGRSLVDRLGLTSFVLFKNRNMAVFFLFAMLLGAALQLTNAYGDAFLSDFVKVPAYANLLAVKYSTIIISISQFSETAFILTIPFFLKRFGIKAVMTMSMLAWVLRFGLFAFGDPAGGLWMIVLSCIIYGMAFDFFNISGSLFVESQADPKIRASAQGLFMLMTNGVGAVLGSLIAGFVIDHFFTNHACDDAVLICKDWHGIWLAFAGYALVMALLFVPLFKHRHDAAAAQQAVPTH
ncbi:nucleoside permease [Rhodanobacter denitrificans]|uniref:Nucleoside transporter n=1 Tax=Rhodanobacter denitrificans TaxID=666685 RepID=M4NS34_9GAMM|nr:nucleoside permease [Rhodanobacter denitrificans]AGG90351.1 nucleoside transporter [Rhodanobacter denitrificans]UJM85738.1 nucleoside permease [Rhodanobacter denitrificans]